jgi:hypothetical protein
MASHVAANSWRVHRTSENVIDDILKADDLVAYCENSEAGNAAGDEVTATALTSIARSLVTLNELILRGYTHD